MTFTAEQIAQAEATADNLAGLLGVDRDTAIRFAEIIRPHFERGDSIEDAIGSARAQVQRLAMHLAGKRGTPEFREFARTACTAAYPALRAQAEARRAA